MLPTARFWQFAAAGVGLTALGVLAARPLAVLGGLGVGIWLLVTQVSAIQEFEQTVSGLEVDVDTYRDAVVVDEELTVPVTVSLPAPAPAPLSVEVSLPAGGTTTDTTRLNLEPGETTASTTMRCSFPVAGEFAFPPVSVSLRNAQGTVTETVRVDPDVIVQVNPRRPRNLHVGQGGDRIAAYGEHPAGSGSGGLVPAEVRRYVSGDSLDQIDWKATARLQSPHVREFETETDRKTVLLVDHQAAMTLGPEGETMLDYVREVALGYAQAAESYNDPLGLYAVGDHGITTARQPVSSPAGYRHIRNRLHDLEPTQSTAGEAAEQDHLSRPRDARTAAHRLAGEGSPFAETVAPFLADTEAYVHRIGSDPLFEAVRRVLAETSGQVWLVLLTTDTGQNRLRDASSLVASDEGSLSLFLTPRVLFEPGAMDDLTGAYERYSSFESFRRSVNRTPRTEAYELGPGDRLDALLAARRRARQ